MFTGGKMVLAWLDEVRGLGQALPSRINIKGRDMAKGYIIAHITVRDAEAYKEYVAKDTPILLGLGGNFIVRGGQSEVPEGEAHDRHVVIEFPSYEAALDAYNDSDYQAVADIRRRTADSTIIVVEGVD